MPQEELEVCASTVRRFAGMTISEIEPRLSASRGFMSSRS